MEDGGLDLEQKNHDRAKKPPRCLISSPAQGRSGTSQIRKMPAPAGLAFGPIDAHEGHQ